MGTHQISQIWYIKNDGTLHIIKSLMEDVTITEAMFYSTLCKPLIVEMPMEYQKNHTFNIPLALEYIPLAQVKFH